MIRPSQKFLNGNDKIKKGDRQTFYAEEIIDDKLRREAAKYGDPDKVLRVMTAPYDEVFGWRYAKK